MSKIYNIAFRMGVLFNILLFTVLNLLTFVETRKKSDECAEMSFAISSCYFYESWGFPLPMFMNQQLFDPYFLVLNTIVYVVCAFTFGFLFKFVWSKISSRPIELK